MTTMAIRGDRELLVGLYLDLSNELDEATRVVRAVDDGDHAGEDIADSGTRVSLREQYASLMASIERRRGQVGRAIERLDAGVYGACERCGCAIASARLEAFPAATTCVDCQRRTERH